MAAAQLTSMAAAVAAGPHTLSPSRSLPLRISAAAPAAHRARSGVAACAAQGPKEQSATSALAAPAAAGGIVAACLGAILTVGMPMVLDAAPALAEATTATPPRYVRLPPLSQDPMRCERAFVGNTIGQANGVADKLLDLRQCDFSGNKKDLKGKTLSAALMADAKFDNADMTEVVMSKAYAGNASFRGVDFSNAVLDRVVFDGADLTGAKFNNTVLSGSTFEGSDLADVDFEDTLIGYVDVQKVCRNTTLVGDSRLQLGCK